jgi:hypothetical protein
MRQSGIRGRAVVGWIARAEEEGRSGMNRGGLVGRLAREVRAGNTACAVDMADDELCYIGEQRRGLTITPRPPGVIQGLIQGRLKTRICVVGVFGISPRTQRTGNHGGLEAGVVSICGGKHQEVPGINAESEDGCACSSATGRTLSRSARRDSRYHRKRYAEPIDFTVRCGTSHSVNATSSALDVSHRTTQLQTRDVSNRLSNNKPSVSCRRAACSHHWLVRHLNVSPIHSALYESGLIPFLIS